MSRVLDELLQLLQLEKQEENLFRGRSQDLGFGAVFGGQVLGQALSAASRTVPPERGAHSLHGYFLRAGDADRPIVYQVDPIRDGSSFSTRRVVAIQNGKAICSVAASFHSAEEGFVHQFPAPGTVPPPEEVEPELHWVQQYRDRIPEHIRAKLLCDKPIEMRVVDPINPFAPEPREPHKYVWLKAADTLPDDPAVHRYLLAYASDFHLVGTALFPHGRTFWDPGMQVASLDHALWFHAPFRMDQWLLHAMDSPSAGQGRGFNRGAVYTRDGTLVASVAQEGLIRNRGPKGERT